MTRARERERKRSSASAATARRKLKSIEVLLPLWGSRRLREKKGKDKDAGTVDEEKKTPLERNRRKGVQTCLSTLSVCERGWCACAARRIRAHSLLC